jgi:quercetin dioxygenase-like cupin family protein
LAKTGDAIENPVSGQRLIFRKTAQDTDGESLEVESVYTKPTPSRPPTHYHPHQEERFEVLAGRLNVLVDGQKRTLEEGEILIVPPGVAHGMWAAEAGARVNWQTRPALKTEAFFETVWGLAKDGKVNDKGVPNLLRAALIAREYEDELRFASPPWAVQKVLFGVLAPVSRLLGYRVPHPYPYGVSEKALPAGHERLRVASGVRLGKVLIAAIVGLSVLILLGRLHRQSSR